jgi:hypothetical protein
MEQYSAYIALPIALANFIWHLVKHTRESSCTVSDKELKVTAELLDVLDKMVDEKMKTKEA